MSADRANDQLNFRNDALRRKFDSIKYDLKRCEDVVYDLALRGLIGTGGAGSSSEKSQPAAPSTGAAKVQAETSQPKADSAKSNENKADPKAQHEHLISLVKSMIPPLSPLLHKGQAGRIGVIGGSGE